MNYTIYTDGCCRISKSLKGKESIGRGGCSCVIIKNDIIVKKISKGFRVSNSSRMELMAVILALENIPKFSKVDLYIDSFMVIDGIKGINTPKKDFDLWTKINKLKKHLKITCHHVKGHNGNKYNELCDALAKEASKDKKKFNEDKPYKQTSLS